VALLLVALAAGAEVGLQWDWPATNTDGTPANPTNLRARVYKRTGTTAAPKYTLKATAATNAATVTLAKGTHTVVAQAYYADAPQAVSAYSAPVTVVVKSGTVAVVK
jgi:hypothetical protein